MRCIHLVIGYKGRVRGRTPTSKIVIHRGNCAKLGLERFEDGTFRGAIRGGRVGFREPERYQSL